MNKLFGMLWSSMLAIIACTPHDENSYFPLNDEAVWVYNNTVKDSQGNEVRKNKSVVYIQTQLANGKFILSDNESLIDYEKTESLVSSKHGIEMRLDGREFLNKEPIVLHK